MEGVRSPACPECGRQIAGPRALLRTRRRWRRAILATLIIALGAITFRGPALWRTSRLHLIPSSILILIAPSDAPPSRIARSPLLKNLPVVGSRFQTATPPAPTADLREEVWRRLGHGKLARWQSQHFLERYLRGKNAIRFWLPARWVASEKVPILVETPIASGRPFNGAAARAGRSGEPLYRVPHTFSRLLVPLGPEPASSLSLDFEVLLAPTLEVQVLYAGRAKRDIEIRNDEGSLLDPVSGSDVDDAVGA